VHVYNRIGFHVKKKEFSLMGNQNKIRLAVGASALIATGFANADFQGISIDEIESGLGIGTTYRVYVNVDSGNQVNAIFGDLDNILRIESGGAGFYQHEYGSFEAPNPALFPLLLSLEYDSFVTIGLATSVGNKMLHVGIDFTAFEVGGDLIADNGAWLATPDDSQVMEVDGRVLIGQFTTTGEVSGVINILGKNADGTSWQYKSIVIPAPSAFVLCGFAVVALRRRRK